MRRVIVGSMLLLAAGTGLGVLAVPYLWLPSGTSTIGPWRAAEAFQQCSRDVPHSDGGYWLPTAADIVELELELWPMLEQRDKLGQPVPPRFQQFRRQHVGFTRNGERLIYRNFSALPEDEPWREWALPERPVNVCDGGSYFWGIVYKPKSKQFEEPQFNGVG
jgi:hypothetical protein